MRAFQPILIAIVVLVGGLKVVPAWMQERRAERLSTPEGYASERLTASFRLEYGAVAVDDDHDGPHVGQLYLVGSVRNEGDRDVAAVILAVRYRPDEEEAWNEAEIDLGPVPARDHRTWREPLGVTWGEEDEEEIRFGSTYEIRVADVLLD